MDGWSGTAQKMQRVVGCELFRSSCAADLKARGETDRREKAGRIKSMVVVVVVGGLKN